MGLLSDNVELQISPTYINYFSKLGYEFPINDYGNGEYHVDKSGTFIAKVSDLPAGSNVMVKIQCDNPACKNIHYVRYNNYLKMMEKYGGVFCRECVLTLFVSGKNHPCWNPDLTDDERIKDRRNKEYMDFLRNVQLRDHYKCQYCGKGGKIEVHHLDGYSWCKEKRFDPDNGVVLCKQCHQSFHKLYGYGDNTHEQYNEWISNKGMNIDNFSQNERAIYSYEENKIYDSVKEFCYIHGIKSTSNVYSVCNHNKSCYTVKGFHVFWVNEYKKLTQDEINCYINNKPIATINNNGK